MEPQARYEELADDLVFRHSDVSLGQMMGMPCINRGGKLAAGFIRSQGAMVFKLPDPGQLAAALAYEGAHLFDPSGEGRPFKQWAVVGSAHADDWPALADQALGET